MDFFVSFVFAPAIHHFIKPLCHSFLQAGRNCFSEYFTAIYG